MPIFRDIYGNVVGDFAFNCAAGSYDAIKPINKFGNNPSVGVSQQTIWTGGGIYSYLSAPSILKLSSGSTNDTSAGTGARTVKIFGLDGDLNLIEEVVALNGQTPVNTTKEYLRVYRKRVITAGSGEINDGVIYAGTGNVAAGVPDNVFSQIIAGFGQTGMAIYTVPANSRLILNHMYAGVGPGRSLTYEFRARPVGEVFTVRLRDTIYQVPSRFGLPTPLRFDAGTDLEMRASVDAGTTEITAGFFGFQIDLSKKLI